MSVRHVLKFRKPDKTNLLEAFSCRDRYQFSINEKNSRLILSNQTIIHSASVIETLG